MIAFTDTSLSNLPGAASGAVGVFAPSCEKALDDAGADPGDEAVAPTEAIAAKPGPWDRSAGTGEPGPCDSSAETGEPGPCDNSAETGEPGSWEPAADTEARRPLAGATDPQPDSRPDSPPACLPACLPDTEALGNEIARLAAHLHAATYELLVLIRAFDEGEGWGCGFRSCADWLSWRTGIGPGPSREKVRVARALGSLPQISEAMARGEMSYSKVRALTRVATPENEADLLDVARHATAAHVERLVRAWRRVDRLAEAEVEAERHRSRYLRLHPDEDGSYVIRGRLDPEVGALLEQALEWAGEALYRKQAREEEGGGFEATEEAPTVDQRRADALGLVAERAMAVARLERWTGAGGRMGLPENPKAMGGSEDGQRPEAAAGRQEPESEREPAPGGDEAPTPAGSAPTLSRADRFQVVLHVEVGGGTGAGALVSEDDRDQESAGPFTGPAVLAGSGLGVSAETSRRLACDASVVRMTHREEGRVLDVGRKRRTVPPAIRRALDHRDRGCRFPGCGCRYTDAHHITHWAEGGETKLDNLVLLCRRHHRATHEEGFRVERGEKAGSVGRGALELRFFRPDGREIPGVPAAPPVPDAPVGAMVRGHRRKGLVPDAWTATPHWHGEKLDLGLAIDMLRGG